MSTNAVKVSKVPNTEAQVSLLLVHTIQALKNVEKLILNYLHKVTLTDVSVLSAA